MTDLQIALLALGLLVVVGVFVYNRVQERTARRRAEQAFPSGRADALMDPPPAGARREPTLEAAARRTDAGAASLPEELPDARLDYIVELEMAEPGAVVTLQEAWAPIASRFGRRVLLATSEAQGPWRRLVQGAQGSVQRARAALQLVTRQGVTGEAEVVEFRAAVETLAAALGASAHAPEMRSTLDAARELDRVCADADIQVVVHVVGADGAAVARAAAEKAAAGLGIAFGRDGRASVRDAQGRDLYSLVFDDGAAAPGLSAVLEVPRAPELERTYDAMLRTARGIADALGGALQDDARRTLDDRALAAIGAELARVRQSLEGLGVTPGGPLALRLFS